MVEDKPKGMSVGPKLHPLTHYMGREAAKMAWDYQQKKIDEMFEILADCRDQLEAHVGREEDQCDAYSYLVVMASTILSKVAEEEIDE